MSGKLTLISFEPHPAKAQLWRGGVLLLWVILRTSYDRFDEGFEELVKVDIPRGITVVTTLFEDLGDKTRLTLRILHATEEDRRKHEEMGVIAGWNSSFEYLDEYLAKNVEKSASKS
ncbi:MAG: SRPBCC domain-containing protein [Rhizonema sp. PD38]|nr:SRPBCC domain-containing protein [Rhizonema sp. PD38]